MGVQVTVEVAQRVVITTFTGAIDDDDILSVLALIRSHPDFDASFSEILDFSEITVASLSTSAIELASQRASNFDLTSMHIIVAPRDFLFGLARMSQALADETRPNVIVVRTVDEARKFLARRNAGDNAETQQHRGSV